MMTSTIDQTPVDDAAAQLVEEQQRVCLGYFDGWSESEQVHFVERLLRKMCHHQHGDVDHYLRPMLQRDFISALPGYGLFVVS